MLILSCFITAVAKQNKQNYILPICSKLNLLHSSFFFRSQENETKLNIVQIKHENSWSPIGYINESQFTLYENTPQIFGTQIWVNCSVRTPNKQWRVAAVIEPPFIEVYPGNAYDPQLGKCTVGLVYWNQTTSNILIFTPHCCTGYSIDLLKRIKNDIDIVLYIYIPSDSTYGSKVNGSWGGLVGELVKEKADLVISLLTIMAARGKVIDFTLPIFEGGLGIATVIAFFKR